MTSTLTVPHTPATQALHGVGVALVEARKKSSLAAVAYVQSVGIDEGSGDLVSLTTLTAAEIYLAALEVEQDALTAYRNAVREVVTLGREWHARTDAKPPTIN